MAEVLADTSGWASFFVRTERFHAVAAALMRRWQAEGVRVVTTNYVLTELVALFHHPLRMPRAHQIKIIESIKTAAWVQVVHIDPTLDEEAWSLLKTRADKEWSMVDCASFALMNRRGIAEALTTDHHFEQAGFRRLLK